MSRVLTTFDLTPHNSIVAIGEPSSAAHARGARPIEIGGDAIILIAGLRVIEGRAPLLDTARRLASAGVSILHGSTHRPAPSADAFEGLALDALEILREAGEATGLRICTEALDPRDVEVIARAVDVILVGGGSMRNRPLLAEIGRAGRAVILERHSGATLDELLDAAEHVMAQGNANVILCERGICTFERTTAATLDVPAIPLLKSLTHLPVIVAPGAGGRPNLVAPLACAAVAAGADALMLEVDGGPLTAQGSASLDAARLNDVVRRIGPYVAAAGRRLHAVEATDSGAGSAALGALHRTADHAARGEHATPTPEALAALRASIEQVDRRIVELIGRRVDLARNAGVVKRDAGLPVIDEEQEHEVLSRVRALASDARLPYEQLHALQAYLIEISRRAQTHPPPSTSAVEPPM